MANTATATPSKTDFVKDFLQRNPLGNVRAVNDAWAAAGMTGKIGDTLINKMRSTLGLTGNLRAKPTSKSSAPAKSAPRTSTPAAAALAKPTSPRSFYSAIPKPTPKP